VEALMKIGWRRFARPSFWGVVVLTIVLGGGAGVYAIVTDLTDVKNVHSAAAVHADQQELMALVLSGQDEEAFDEAFELGDDLFATLFNAIDGVGANVGRGQRFTRVPRADLKGTGEWFRHTPARVTGPNSNACNSCHFRPFEDGAGDASANVHRTPSAPGSSRSSCNGTPPTCSRPGPSSAWRRR
jgi:hypothetical protein